MSAASDAGGRLSPSVLRAALDSLADRSDSSWSGTASSSLAQVSRAVYLSHHKRRAVGSGGVDVSSGSMADALVDDLPPEVDRLMTEVVTRPTDNAEQAVPVVIARGVRIHVPDAELTRLPDGRLAADMPAIRVGLSPGYVSYIHQQPADDEQPDSLLRLYVSIDDATAAPPIWRKVLQHLCVRKVSFSAKCLSVPGAYPTSDALVIYTSQSSFDALGELSRDLEPMAGISADASVFTRQIATGCSVAVEVRNARSRSTSFGQHRSSALARALLDVHHSGSIDDETVARSIAEAFQDDGIDPARPYLPLSPTKFSDQVSAWLESAP